MLGFYDYVPSLGGNVLLLVLFTSLVPAIALLGYRHKTPLFSAVLGLGLLLNAVGFVGRILLRAAADDQGYLLLFLLGSMLGPSATVGAVFLVLPHVLAVYGERFCPCKPLTMSLVLYAVLGSAVAAEVVGAAVLSYALGGDRLQGARILVAGLGLQTAALVGSMILYGKFAAGLPSNRSTLDLKHFTTYGNPAFTRFRRCLEISTTLLLVYSIYRLIELALGIRATLFQSEAAFMVMDGALPLLSSILLTVAFPGAVFGTAWPATSPRRRRRRAPPPPLRHRDGYQAHHRYDPNIRKQFSPESQRSARSVPSEGSPGLPVSPRPAHKQNSPKMQSPRSVMTGSTQRYSGFEDRRISDIESRRYQDLVDSEDIW